ncbi:MAG: peptidase C39 family protein [Planctomycetota bacterium]
MRIRPLLTLALILALGPAHAGEWELGGPRWAHGQHAGTRVEGGALTLASGAAVGTWSCALPSGGASFDRLLSSLNPDGPWPSGAGATLEVRVRVQGAWSAWLPLGVYGRGAGLPRSVTAPTSVGAKVDTDLLVAARAADACELRLGLSASATAPRLRRLALDLWTRRAAAPEPPRTPHPAWGRVLDVPRRSQRSAPRAIAGRVCSPTSLGMALAFHGVRCTTEQVAAAVFDAGADAYGNWSFNVAYAAERGLEATARHLEGFAALEDEVAAGRPVVLSHRYPAGALTGGPVEATEGHLIVVVGFDAQGDVVVNDPAATPETVRRTYRRAELWRTWQHHAEGVVYLLRPR